MKEKWIKISETAQKKAKELMLLGINSFVGKYKNSSGNINRIHEDLEKTFEKTVVIGDPQAPIKKLMDMLAINELLSDDGFLKKTVRLVSIGDHFDYDAESKETAQNDASSFIAWLAYHSKKQVYIILGNHDTARVQELIKFSDEEFQEAYNNASSVLKFEKNDTNNTSNNKPDNLDIDQLNAFYKKYPSIPSALFVTRDVYSYTTNQRDWIINLLLLGRCHLALEGVLKYENGIGKDKKETKKIKVLLTHAGVVLRDVYLLKKWFLAKMGKNVSSEIELKLQNSLNFLGNEDDRISLLSRLLNEFLFSKISEVSSSWNNGILEPLDLSPLYEYGISQNEAGGLLAHRPSCISTSNCKEMFAISKDGIDKSDKNEYKNISFDPDLLPLIYRQRRFHPATMIPNIYQICGHSGHKKCLVELEPILTKSAIDMELGNIRTISIIQSEFEENLFSKTLNGDLPDDIELENFFHSTKLEYKANIDIDSNYGMILIDGEINKLPSLKQYKLIYLDSINEYFELSDLKKF